MRGAAFELVFMLVILKLPVVYLCLVVWWAVRAQPRPLEGAARVVVAPPSTPPFGRRSRARPPRPHGSPTRRYPRVPGGARATTAR